MGHIVKIRVGLLGGSVRGWGVTRPDVKYYQVSQPSPARAAFIKGPQCMVS